MINKIIFLCLLFILIIILILKKKKNNDFFSNNIRKLTIYFPYYNQPIALQKVLNIYNKFSEKLKKNIEIFIVDDGSQKFPTLPYIKNQYNNLNITLYRINKDIPWNQPEANNLAFSKAKYENILRLDIDHHIDEKNLNNLFNENIDLNKYVYYPKCIEINENNKKKRPHQNCYLVSKKNYWKVGGYNELFSGNYGYDDIEFKRRLEKIIPRKNLENIFINRNNNFFTKNLNRDVKHNKKLLHKCNKSGCSHLTFRNKKYYIKKI